VERVPAEGTIKYKTADPFAPPMLGNADMRWPLIEGHLYQCMPVSVIGHAWIETKMTSRNPPYFSSAIIRWRGALLNFQAEN
jgi:hypothetical protein